MESLSLRKSILGSERLKVQALGAKQIAIA